MANKSISELDEYVGLIQGDEILIISKEEENAGTYQYVSKYYKLQTLANEVSSSVLYVVSNDVSTFISDTSALISNLTADVSTAIAISIIANTSAVISTFLNDVSTHVSNDLSAFKNETSSSLCAFVENAIPPLKKIMGLSTLNYYTFIGDDINKLSADPKYPELSSLSDDVIWFDTKDDPNFHRIANIRRMDNLQVQIYRLGLQLRDVHKILENGVIPGDAYNNTKDEMIEFADEVQPPDEVTPDENKLLGISIYGNYACKNGQMYYIMFDPSGFIPETTLFKWVFNKPDPSDDSTTTVSYSLSNNMCYSLKAHLDDSEISCVAKMRLSAAIYDETTVITPTYLSDQQVINDVISVLTINNVNNTSFYVSSDYVDIDYSADPIVSEPFEAEFISNDVIYGKLLSVDGDEYIDKTSLYYAIFNGEKKKLPQSINTNWYFLSAHTLSSGEQEMVKVDNVTRIVPLDQAGSTTGWVNYRLMHYLGTPICQISASHSDNCTPQSIKSISAEVFVESNFDNTISSSYVIKGIGGVKPDTSKIEPTVKSVCAKVDKKQNLQDKTSTLYTGELVYFSDLDQLAVWNGEEFMALNSSSSSGLSKEQIQNIGLDYLNFSPTLNQPSINKLFTTTDGKVNVVQQNKNSAASDLSFDPAKDYANIYGSHLLQIGKVFCGGPAITDKEVTNTKKPDLPLVSHNYVEIVNASDDEIFLDKVYLIYHTSDPALSSDPIQSGNSQMQFLKLEGSIKPHKTYLVRGAKCNPCKSVLVDVKDCDLEWKRRTENDNDILNGKYDEFTRSGKLIEFSERSGSFMLFYATPNADDKEKHGDNIKDIILEAVTPANADGYIDLFGLKGDIAPAISQDGKGYISPTGTLHNMMIEKWFYMDPAKQGNKNKSARKEPTVITSVNLKKQQDIIKSGNSRDKYYYDDTQKVNHGPTTSQDDRGGIFSNKSMFTAKKPNVVNVTFGIQATEIPSANAREIEHDSETYYTVNLLKVKEALAAGSAFSKEFEKTKNIQVTIDESEVVYTDANEFKKDGSPEIPHGGKIYFEIDPSKKHSALKNEHAFDINFSSKKTVSVTIDESDVMYTDDKQFAGTPASRCFNWVSVGYFDEFIKYRRIKDAVGADVNDEWKKAYSITKSDSAVHGGIDWYAPFHELNAITDPVSKNNYDRFRWISPDGTSVTTHKVILHECLIAGEYEFVIGRDDDSSYQSDPQNFTVRTDNDVQEFSFIQVSDQQGFNWIEYQAWKASCKELSKNESGFDFTINTGDIAQSGNRPSEWIDYFDGRAPLKSKEEMFTIGNNDLCGFPKEVLGDGNDNTSKFNLINVLHYYTFELDPLNPPFSVYLGQQYPLYSLYSFNYGKWHFISVVSEIREFYGFAFQISTGQKEFAKKLNADVENWVRRDLINYKEKSGVQDCSKCIAFMHEMPFTIVTPSFFDVEDTTHPYSDKGRSIPGDKGTGCKLNVENEYGDYRFSRLFKKAGIRLIIGGHKHTFSLSMPIYDAPENILIPDNSEIQSVGTDDTDPFMNSTVGVVESRKPIIELPLMGSYNFISDSLETLSAKAYYSELLEIKTKLDEDVQHAMATDDKEAVYNAEQSFHAHFKELMDACDSKEEGKDKIVMFDDLKDEGAALKNFARFRYVKKVSAPVYIMSQATGYKVVSNKELPASTSGTVSKFTPWLMSFCASLKDSYTDADGWKGSQKGTQLRPTYIRYDITNDAINATIKQVDGIYSVSESGTTASSGSYNLDIQDRPLKCVPVTFGSYAKEYIKDTEVHIYTPSLLPAYQKIYADYVSNDTYTINL